MSLVPVVRSLAVLSALLVLVLALSFGGVRAATVSSSSSSSSCTVSGPATYGASGGTTWDDQGVAESGTTSCQTWPTSVTLYYDNTLNAITGINTQYSNGQSAAHGNTATSGTNQACSTYTFSSKSLVTVTVNYDSNQVYQISLGSNSATDSTLSCGTAKAGASSNSINSAANGWIGYFAGSISTSTCGSSSVMAAFGAASVSTSAVNVGNSA